MRNSDKVRLRKMRDSNRAFVQQVRQLMRNSVVEECAALGHDYGPWTYQLRVTLKGCVSSTHFSVCSVCGETRTKLGTESLV